MIRDDLSPKEIISVALKRQAKRSRRLLREEASLDAPDYRALMRRQDILHKTKFKGEAAGYDRDHPPLSLARQRDHTLLRENAIRATHHRPAHPPR